MKTKTKELRKNESTKLAYHELQMSDMTFDAHSFNEREIDELKEFQSFVNGVDKSCTQPRKSGNYLHFHIKEYHLLKDPIEIELYHKLGTFPYEGGIFHVYNPMKRIPTLEFVAGLK